MLHVLVKIRRSHGRITMLADGDHVLGRSLAAVALGDDVAAVERQHSRTERTTATLGSESVWKSTWRGVAVPPDGATELPANRLNQAFLKF